MNYLQISVIYLLTFRITVIVAGIISVVLGYRLFCRGVFPGFGGKEATSVDAKIGEAHITLKNAAPGTCFALFGVIIISSMLITGGPEVSIKYLDEAAQYEAKVEKATKDLVSLEMRGDEESGGLAAATKQGIFFEEQKNISKAIDSYQRAISIMATPMNNLAWLYLVQGEIEKALPLSKLAVDLSPDNANYHDTLAEVFFKSGKFAEALTSMEKAANLHSKYKEKLERFRKAAQ
jgi:tetratricopeptide (TPR) repeat protein